MLQASAKRGPGRPKNDDQDRYDLSTQERKRFRNEKTLQLKNIKRAERQEQGHLVTRSLTEERKEAIEKEQKITNERKEAEEKKIREREEYLKKENKRIMDRWPGTILWNKSNDELVNILRTEKNPDIIDKINNLLASRYEVQELIKNDR